MRTVYGRELEIAHISTVEPWFIRKNGQRDRVEQGDWQFPDAKDLVAEDTFLLRVTLWNIVSDRREKKDSRGYVLRERSHRKQTEQIHLLFIGDF